MRGLWFWVAFVLLLPQALWVKRTTPRFKGALKESYGSVSPQGLTNRSKVLHFVALGDSIIAGVGADTQDESLVVQICQALANQAGRRIMWVANGKIGADARVIARRGQEMTWPEQTDVVLISTGVNDLLGLTSIGDWAGRIDALVRAVRTRAPHATIVFCGLPPMHRFPSLPWPLRGVLGMRARHLDEVLRMKVADLDQVIWVGIEGEVGPDLFSADGFHPGPQGYAQFAKHIAETVAHHY